MENTIVWFDLAVANLERASKFYSTVLNCQLEMSEYDGCKMAIFPHDNGKTQHLVAGCLYETATFKPNTSDLLIYFNVEGFIDTAANKVVDAGGAIVSNVEQIGQYGHRAVILDSEGNKVALYSKVR